MDQEWAKETVVTQDRRTLLKVLSGAFGSGAASVVGFPAFKAFVSPAGKITVSGQGEFVTVAEVEALPTDGTPMKLPVVVEAPMDAWTKLPPTEIGAIYLLRTGEQITALSSICPHLGCGIDYSGELRAFTCPCHESKFELTGGVAGGPSPRGMDTLETRTIDGRVQVLFEKFKTGSARKTPA